MQAIRRWEAEHNRRKNPRSQKRTYRIPRVAMRDLLKHVRELQRCNGSQDWDRAVSKFLKDVEECLCSTHRLKPGVFVEVEAYFRNNRMSEDRRCKLFWWPQDKFCVKLIIAADLWTDMGLPEPGSTRDGVLNTNNWIESAFKTFKAIFLGGKKNRRYILWGTSRNRS